MCAGTRACCISDAAGWAGSRQRNAAIVLPVGWASLGIVTARRPACSTQLFTSSNTGHSTQLSATRLHRSRCKQPVLAPKSQPNMLSERCPTCTICNDQAFSLPAASGSRAVAAATRLPVLEATFCADRLPLAPLSPPLTLHHQQPGSSEPRNVAV